MKATIYDENRNELEGLILRGPATRDYCTSCDGSKKPIKGGESVQFFVFDVESRKYVLKFETGTACYKKHTTLTLGQIPSLCKMNSVADVTETESTSDACDNSQLGKRVSYTKEQISAYRNVFLRGVVFKNLGFDDGQEDILKIAGGLKIPFSDVEIERINKYVDRGVREYNKDTLENLERILPVASLLHKLLKFKSLNKSTGDLLCGYFAYLKKNRRMTDNQMATLEDIASENGITVSDKVRFS